MTKETILITGACGQLGTEITLELIARYGEGHVIATDVRIPPNHPLVAVNALNLDVLDINRLSEMVSRFKVTQIYHLAALLSASAEKNPNVAWQINIQGFMNVLDVAKTTGTVHKIYFPSSIAVFGPHTPRENTPQFTTTDPTTVYGISKLVGERLSEYYFLRYGTDVRSLRYPGIISWKHEPGGGTTDYAVDIYFQAARQKAYTCYLGEDTYLPMMYMPDAMKATFDLMEAEAARVKIRSGYNLGAMSFSPKEVAAAIRQHIPDFQIAYQPDFRQAIADSWPASIDDSAARADWGWKPDYDLARMTQDMLQNLMVAH